MIKRVRVVWVVLVAVAYLSAVLLASMTGARGIGDRTALSWNVGGSGTYSGRYVKGNQVCVFTNEVIGDGAIAIDRHCAVEG